MYVNGLAYNNLNYFLSVSFTLLRSQSPWNDFPSLAASCSPDLCLPQPHPGWRGDLYATAHTPALVHISAKRSTDIWLPEEANYQWRQNTKRSRTAHTSMPIQAELLDLNRRHQVISRAVSSYLSRGQKVRQCSLLSFGKLLQLAYYLLSLQWLYKHTKISKVPSKLEGGENLLIQSIVFIQLCFPHLNSSFQRIDLRFDYI